MDEIIIMIIKVVVVLFGIALHLAALCTWLERKGSALLQDRIGANRAGRYISLDSLIARTTFSANPLKWAVYWGINLTIMPFIRLMGMLGVINTLMCDAVKALFKEDFVPQGTSNFIHSLAPFLACLPIFVSFALIPIAPKFDLFGYHIIPQVATIDAGVLFIFAMGSVSVYGVALAGWTGNNKYSLLGGLRAAAQMISYELAMGVTFIAVILTYGTLDLYQMVERQTAGVWGVVSQPLGFVLLFIVGMAETKRAPFDLPESESELVAGYFTEYSGMKFLLFWLGEFAEIALFSFLLAILFFGGWSLPGLNSLYSQFGLAETSWIAALIGHLILMTKVVFFCVLQIVIRWTLPRFRYDQLMTLGWKYLLPLSMINLMITAAIKVMV